MVANKNRILLQLFGVMLISLVVTGFAATTLLAEQGGEKVSAALIECLAKNGLVVYGRSTCPACQNFASSFGGYQAISPFYVECSSETERCVAEKQTGYVPEFQIKGKLYQGSRAAADLAREVGCKI